MGQKREGKLRGLFSILPPPSQDGSSGEFWTEFPKTLTCNSVSQTEPPTADTLLTSATLPSDTSPDPLLPPSRGGGPSSLEQIFPHKGTHFANEAQCGFRWYSLGSKLLWVQAQISLEAGWGRHFSLGLLTLDVNRFHRKSHNAAQLCFPLSPFPHT